MRSGINSPELFRAILAPILVTGLLLAVIAVPSRPAYAQSNYQSLCQGSGSTMQANFSSTSQTAQLGVNNSTMKVDWRVTFPAVVSPTEAKITLYRATTREGIYGQVEARSIQLTRNGLDWTASGSFTNDPPNGSYIYALVAQAKSGSQTLKSCSPVSQPYTKGSATPPAQTDNTTTDRTDDESRAKGRPTFGLGLPFGNLTNPTFAEYFNGLVNYAMVIASLLAVLVIIYAGIIYSQSQGQADRVSLAKELIAGALTGLALLLMIRFILPTLNIEDEQRLDVNTSSYIQPGEINSNV